MLFLLQYNNNNNILNFINSTITQGLYSAVLNPRKQINNLNSIWTHSSKIEENENFGKFKNRFSLI